MTSTVKREEYKRVNRAAPNAAVQKSIREHMGARLRASVLKHAGVLTFEGPREGALGV